MIKNSILCKLVLSALATATFLSVARTEAETIFGITDAAQLFSFDSATPGTVASFVGISGITGGQSLVAIDFRPSNGQLYGLSYASGTGAAQLYVIDTITGVAAPVGSGLTLATGSSRFAFDFNPSVDLVRVIGSNDSNVRINPSTGAIAGTDTSVAYATGDSGFGANPFLAAAAYNNNVPGGSPTTLYAYDFARDVLVTVGGVNGSPSPNGGQLFTINSTGITAGTGSMGFDISGLSGVGYFNIDTAATGTTDNLYTVNLATGALTLVGGIGAPSVLDISVRPIPEPNTVALLGVALSTAGVSAWRRRRVCAVR